MFLQFQFYSNVQGLFGEELSADNLSWQEAWGQWNKTKNNLDTGERLHENFALIFSDDSFEYMQTGK